MVRSQKELQAVRRTVEKEKPATWSPAACAPALSPAADRRAWRYRHLRVRVAGSIGFVTLSNPPWNALSSLMIDDIEQALAAVLRANDVRVVVLSGEGETFSIGVEAHEILRPARELRELARKAKQLLERIEQFSKPVIAAINGHCLGGGLELALACHMRVASDRAKLGLPEVSLGLLPGLGATQRLPAVVGRARAHEMILTGRLIRAEVGLRMGLLNAVVAPEEVLPSAARLARRIAVKRPEAVQAAMRCLNCGSQPADAVGQLVETRFFEELLRSDSVRDSLRSLGQSPTNR